MGSDAGTVARHAADAVHRAHPHRVGAIHSRQMAFSKQMLVSCPTYCPNNGISV
jgi:hypothetical protein